MNDYELAFLLFVASKGNRNEDIYGINTIKEYVKVKKRIPEELLPLVLEACDAWKEKTGNKGRVRKMETEAKWNKLIVEVRHEFQVSKSVKISDAVVTVAKKHNVNAETLLEYHNSPKHKITRKAGDTSYCLDSWAIDQNQDLVELYYQKKDLDKKEG